MTPFLPGELPNAFLRSFLAVLGFFAFAFAFSLFMVAWLILCG